MERRLIKKIIRGSASMDGAGVKLTRVLGLGTVKDFDPFLMLDIFDSTSPDDYTRGFPWHPHRGIETITYLIEGEIEHGDSIGSRGTIYSGGCQWMRAGSGIMHYEMPKASPRMLGMQLWLNMPAEKKMIPPQYNDLTAEMITTVTTADAEVKVISGDFQGTIGPMEHPLIPIRMLDVALKADGKFELDVASEDNLFIYVFRGAVEFPDGSKATQTDAALTTAGDRLEVRSGAEGARFVVLQGKPLCEPIFWRGPVVMDTQEGLTQAFVDLQNDTFIK
jgi:hypothetical protein